MPEIIYIDLMPRWTGEKMKEICKTIRAVYGEDETFILILSLRFVLNDNYVRFCDKSGKDIIFTFEELIQKITLLPQCFSGLFGIGQR